MLAMNKTGSSRRRFLTSALSTGSLLAFTPAIAAARGEVEAAPSTTDRERWLAWLERVSEPVLAALGRRDLRKTMPVESVPGHEAERAVGTHLEALGRLLAGIAPWLELEPSPGESAHETALRTRYRTLAVQGIASAADPGSPDYMRFGQSGQTLVDSSFLSLALLRAPKSLLGALDASTRARLITALEAERTVQPPFNNWLLFAALNEVLLRALGAPWDRLRIDYALRELQAWYLGDGTYGDGPHFHADFYNSYVIHPYLLAIMDAVGGEPAWKGMSAPILERARRFAAIQERVIGPEGTFPVLGRSLCYRCGAFHLLADAALRGVLPHDLQPAIVRSALTAVQQRTLDAPGTFTPEGWLRIGLAGHQPGLAETYISTGSLYLCSAVWLPLGLPPAHPFWSGLAGDWTQKAIWSGGNGPADHALAEERSGT